MYQEQRLSKILQLLDERGQLSSKEAIGLLGVSRDTIRRDFAQLSQEGLAVRMHGGILLLQKENPIQAYNQRLNHSQVQKDQMASRTLELINPGQSIFIDVSTSLLRLAQKLDFEARVYTHSMDNALVLSQHQVIDLYQLGGRFHAKNRFFYSLNEAELLKDVRLDIAFIGAAGLSDAKVTFDDQEDVMVKKLALSQARTKVLVAELEKYERSAHFILNQISDFDYWITDQKPDQWLIDSLEGQVELIKVGILP
ncbi:DeoR/GlpR family DNA-binding transcription regulator [Streptococcus loxodontisalivarius]|uniref:DeoR/GlpR family transcriptional regulator of sugar metabolism n=1 Tax=Streptococcus loxodontisalivarius TaxID=1349415 RepID=A0ABS2PTD2_9STRE|nr:DeoR/GlpR family DNA-binding transcription regulator [Streptococcus loxodontisalivarius]MBM7643308.1 DeoR/GlpR family transcriptional regulator of sugar metabolism [Streptococcus loxodontisalivarius]